MPMEGSSNGNRTRTEVWRAWWSMASYRVEREALLAMHCGEGDPSPLYKSRS